MKFHAPAVLAAAFALALPACGNEAPAGPSGPLASAPVASAVKPVSQAAVKLSVDPGGSATFDMKAPIENIKGIVKGFGGELSVDLMDLTKTRGAVTMDLTTLETHTFGEEGKDKTQSEHAHGWLQVGSSSAEDVRGKVRNATFTIKDVTAAEPKNIMAATGDSRAAKVTAKGDFFLHGKTVEKTVELEVTFQYEGATLKSVAVKTAKPAVVSLKEHAIEPRDDKGEVVLSKVLELFGKKVAEEAQVTFELTAKPGATAPAAAPAAPAAPK